MLTAVHSDNPSEYRPLLKQLLLAQPEHRVLERLGRSSPAIAQLAHRFLAREEHALARHTYGFHRNASRAAGQAPHGLGRVSDRQQRGVGQADARRAAPGDPGNLHENLVQSHVGPTENVALAVPPAM